MFRRLMWWSVIGFCVPIGWGILSFMLFSAKESTWTTVYWWCVYITCPFWAASDKHRDHSIDTFLERAHVWNHCIPGDKG
jgi:hypothetical protein